MIKRITGIFAYIKWLITKQNELQKYHQELFRIIKVVKNKNDQNILHVQVVNKSTVFYCSAAELATTDYLIEGFSKANVRLITYLATTEIYNPKRRIISLRLCAKLKQILFKIKSPVMGRFEELTLTEIISSKEVLNEFSQEDAYRIGFYTGIDHANINN